MATMTAQILVGSAHPYDGGINPDYYMFLSENGMARWTIVSENMSAKHIQSGDQRMAQWIPTIEFMLEDALLMIGIYILKDNALVNMTKQFFNEEIPRTADLNRDFPAKALEMMRKRTCELEFQYKMTLSVFKGSSILKQLKILEEYPMDVEVCVPVFLREYNIWNQKQEVIGCLESPQ
ncbi:hypothetical protein [Neobacillus vireti]|uniref:Uncharacterized protein n=1 Tax=Neobacillus vireti LMG 21834 TaxID=1131730 RepID=A0AB94IU87_9BACI|nr:hypothetical protein [Neobacillus vireti]ETI70547.1 hypothetical protein BAVI_02324 [Neobacillus vireti LMG 21834]